MIEASTTAFVQSNNLFGLTVPLAEGIINNTTFSYLTFPESRHMGFNMLVFRHYYSSTCELSYIDHDKHFGENSYGDFRNATIDRLPA
jgi:hypothetical protein